MQCPGEEEQEEIVNMLYAYNLAYGANGPDKSLEQPEDFFREAGIDDPDIYRKEICASSAQTFTKNFYRTLAIKLLSDDEKAFALDIMDFRESVKHYDNIFALGRK